MATAQMLGDRQGLFPERNRTQCPSPEVLRAAGCNINCIQRNMTSDEGCAYCNRTCNGLFVHNSTPNLLMVFYCPENCIENVCRVQQQLTSCFWFTHIVELELQETQSLGSSNVLPDLTSSCWD